MTRKWKIAFAVAAVLALLGGGLHAWSTAASFELLSRTVETHSATFPIPFPLTPAELADMGIETDGGDAIALERARDRGRHLVEARYGCGECHGRDFSGGVMIDAFPIGSLLGPNLTMGEGSATIGYTSRDWDRIVRHGVKPDGTPAKMPSEDFQLMSDQELSDIVVYLRSVPPMFGEVPASMYGPIGKLLVATGEMPLSVDLIGSHEDAHAVYPPAATVSVGFGRHLAGVCTGCHGPTLSGGPISAGDPSWPAAANLTPSEEGLASWTYGDFATAMRQGVRPDGAQLREPMTLMMPYARNMTDVELEALWVYLRSLAPA